MGREGGREDRVVGVSKKQGASGEQEGVRQCAMRCTGMHGKPPIPPKGKQACRRKRQPARRGFNRFVQEAWAGHKGRRGGKQKWDREIEKKQ